MAAEDRTEKVRKCNYTRVQVGSHSTLWSTECGRSVSCQAPTEVGIWFALPPNADGDYCHYCGGLIATRDAERLADMMKKGGA